LLRYFAAVYPSFPVDEFDGLDIAADVADVREQMQTPLFFEPIPEAVTALYFGLFTAVDQETREEYAGYYICGVGDFDPNDSDTLCDPVYLPDLRYMRSDVLDRVIGAAQKHPEHAHFLQYAAMLGLAALITKFAAEQFSRTYRVVVGFDAGDVIAL